MSLDISSFAGKLNTPVYTGPTHRPEKESNRSGLKINPVNKLDANQDKLGSAKTDTLDLTNISANHKVNFRINQETQDVVIRVVDSESGKLVKQIPGEDFVKLAQNIAEFNQRFLDETT
jgi:flagellar protein FlaG